MNQEKFIETDKFLMTEVIENSDIETFIFPKYTTQFMNLANQNAQWTTPKMVWQLSDLIQEIPEKSISEWKKWYLTNMWEKIDIATDKVREMIQTMKPAYESINKEMVKNRVYDLVINKTAQWLMYQEFILKSLWEKYWLKYRLATPEEEAKNIDGFIWDIPVQIKSESFKSKKSTVREEIQVAMIYYKATDKYLTIDDSEFSDKL